MMSKLFLLATMVASTTAALGPALKTIEDYCVVINKGDTAHASGLYMPTTGDPVNVPIGEVAPGGGTFCPHCKGVGAGTSAMFSGDVFWEVGGKLSSARVLGAAEGGCDTNDGKDCTAEVDVLYCPDLTKPVPKGCTGIDIKGTEPVTYQASTFFPVTFKGAEGEGNLYYSVPKGSKFPVGAYGIWCLGAVTALGIEAPVDGTFFAGFYQKCTVVKKGDKAAGTGLFIPGEDCTEPVAGTVEAAAQIPDPIIRKEATLIAQGVKEADLPARTVVTNADGKALDKDGKVAKNQPAVVGAPCTADEAKTMFDCQSKIDVAGLTDKSSVCKYYQDYSVCMPSCYCDDKDNAPIFDAFVKSSETTLKVMDVKCVLKCGALSAGSALAPGMALALALMVAARLCE